ncbi:MAG: hypothetical protein K0Q97_1074 [Bacillota bacterium]|nr:hypothetical protein [Bacillota bacterium]
MASTSVSRVKGIVESCVGKKVKFKVRKGKSRSLICEGVISDTYPAVFTVSVDNRGLKRVLSFNYIDILTNYVEFFLCNDEETRII